MLFRSRVLEVAAGDALRAHLPGHLVKKRAGARDDAAIATAAGQPDDDLAKLKRCLEYEFADAALLAAALTHPSLPRHRAARRGDDFERLEFLGDRVLSLVVADWLFGRFPDESEGDLAKRHAELVRRDSLALVATAIGLDGALRDRKSTHLNSSHT